MRCASPNCSSSAGAEVDPYELNYNNTPLDFAVYHDYPRMIELLIAPQS